MASKRADVFASTPLLRSLPERLTICSLNGSVELDHATLERRVSGRAEEIRETLGDRSGQIVVSVSDPIEGLIDLFAVWASGNCAVLVSPELSDDEKTRVNAKVTPLLWATPDTLQSVDGTALKAPWPEAVLILMTSGTTGDPKGVTHSLGSLEKRLHLNLSEIGAETLAQRSARCRFTLVMV